MIFGLNEKHPTIGENCFVAPNAAVIGDVVLQAKVTIWFGVTIRADIERITIGQGSNIQDGSVLHVDRGVPLLIGENVTVGHKVMLHGCSIGDGSLIGMNAVVLNNAVIGKGCLIGANTLITEGMVVPDGSMVLGSPGKIVKTISENVQKKFLQGALHYQQLGQTYLDSLTQLDG